jgi:hypothetical protein
VGDDSDTLACIFCCLELADSESQNVIGAASDRLDLDQSWKAVQERNYITQLIPGRRFRTGRSFMKQFSSRNKLNFSQ